MRSTPTHNFITAFQFSVGKTSFYCLPTRKTTGNISFPLAPGHYGLSPLPSEHSEKQAEDRKDQGSPGEQSQSSPACSQRGVCAAFQMRLTAFVQTAANHQPPATRALDKLQRRPTLSIPYFLMNLSPEVLLYQFARSAII